MHVDAWTGIVEDDMTRFYTGRTPWQVTNADVWRWRACCEAQREMDRENR